MTTLTLCQTCPAGQSTLASRLGEAIAREGLVVSIAGVECMSGCARASTFACRSAGKTAYLFGDITEADFDDILNFLRLYIQSPDGNFADARVLGGLRLKALARIPG